MSDALVKQTSAEIELTSLANELSDPLISVEALANVANRLLQLTDLADELATIARRRITDLVKKAGHKTSDKGSLKFEDAGWVFELRAKNSGYNSKRVEALLRAKGYSPGTYMQTVITYAVDPDKLVDALHEQVFTKDELATCRYEEAFSVQRPRPVVIRQETNEDAGE